MKHSIFTVLISLIILTASAGITEESVLNDYGEMIFRPDSLTLCIATAEGDTLVFTDAPNPAELDVFCVYRALAYLPQQNYWVIWIIGHEWDGWLLINGENGRIKRTVSMPVTSPDGTRFLCAKADLGACFVDNGIQIWRIDSDTLALEFEDLDVAWEPHNTEWISDSVVIFDRQYCYWKTWDIKILPGRLELSSDGTWVPENPQSWE